MKFNLMFNISFKLKTLQHTKNWETSNFIIRLLVVLICLFIAHSKGLYNYHTITGFALYISLILWMGIKLYTTSNWTFLDVIVPTFIDISASILLIVGSENATSTFIPLAYLVILLTLSRLPSHKSIYLTYAYILFLTGYFIIYEKNTSYIFASLFMLLAALIIYKILRKMEILEVAANTDALTGAFNRRYFNKYIHLLASYNPIMMMVDINNLKQINDKFGHNCGDQVIKTVADTLKTYSNNNGVTIRWGGDEFLLILCHISEQEYMLITDQIKTDISQNFIVANNVKIPISVSIGISQKNENESFIDTVNRVDKIMYQEKNKIHHRSESRYTGNYKNDYISATQDIV